MNKYLFILLLVSKISVGQTTQPLRSLLYNLPMDSSRKAICQLLKTNPKFTEKTDRINATEDTYSGICKDQGLITSKPDSIIISLSYGKAVIHDDNNTLVKTKILYLKYYFTSLEIATSEYSKLLTYIKPLAKDSSTSAFGDEDAGGEGMYYNLSAKITFINDIDISLATCAAGNFAVFITYTRMDE